MPKLATLESKWASPHLYLKRAADNGLPLTVVAAEWLLDARHSIGTLRTPMSAAGQLIWNQQSELFVNWISSVQGPQGEVQWQVARGILTQLAYQVVFAHSGGDGATALKKELDDQVDKGAFFLQRAINKVTIDVKKPVRSDTSPPNNFQAPPTKQPAPGRNVQQQPQKQQNFFRRGHR